MDRAGGVGARADEGDEYDGDGDEPGPGGHLPLAYLIGRFHQAYPGAYRDVTYPTRDKVIPLGRFVAMSSAIQALEAAQLHHDARAVSLGKAWVEVSDKERSKVERAFRKLERVAFPLVYPPDQSEQP